MKTQFATINRGSGDKISVLSWQKLCEHVGLSEYEAKVYVSLVTKGPSKARKLSAICGVPRTKVYGVLKKLIESGLVIETPEEPRRFVPTPPVDAFKAYLQSFEKKANELYWILSFLEVTYEKMKTTTKPQREEAWIIRGRPEILQRVHEMLSQAEKFVDIMTTENGLILFYKTNNKLLDKLEEKGVKIRISAPISSQNQNVAQELRYVCEVKHVDVPSPILFIYVDRREFLLASLMPDDFGVVSGEDVGVYSQNSILCVLMSLLLLKPEKEVFLNALKPLAVKHDEFNVKVEAFEKWYKTR